jgi:hypothetical protein
MARTKKYLTSSKTRSKHSFYRPLKRIQRSQDSDELLSFPDTSPSNLPNIDGLKDLEEKIAQAQKLKQELDQKIKLQLNKVEELKKDNHSYSQEEPQDTQSQPDIRQPVNYSSPPPQSPISAPKQEEASIDFVNHDVGEKISLLEKELEHSFRKEDRFKNDLEGMKQSFLEERKKLESTIKGLRKDMHRSEPITQNKFLLSQKNYGK